ncbi:MAG TPA: hypothetical protein VKT49_05600 [Bryobacteraceae bacterium]|nr:hypothetical protein [Bryobacteraceae bacterium]
MRKVAVLALLILNAFPNSQGQEKKAGRVTGAAQPACAAGAICFSGEIREGHEFRKHLNDGLDFVVSLPGGIDVVSRQSDTGCKLAAWVANPPLHAHHATEIDAGYDWTAELEVESSPREFRFATNCADFQALYDLSQAGGEKYFAQRDSLAKGQGRFWITAAKVTHSHGSISRKNGAVVRMKFSVEIQLPKGK